MMIAITLVIVLLGLIYTFSKWKHSYWSKRGIPGPKPVPILGTTLDTILMRKHSGIAMDDFYKEFPNDSYVGLYTVFKPTLMVRNPEHIKTILVKEFNSFQENDFDVDEKADPLFATNPFLQSGAKWKRSRGQITPCFTSGKIKAMFPLMVEICERQTKYLDANEEAKSSDGIEVKELSAKYTTDVVASCAFGLDAETFTNPESKFREMGKKIFATDTISMIKFTIAFVIPAITKIISIPFVTEEVTKWFTQVVNDTVKYRENNNIQREDFLQAMMALKNKDGYDFTNLEMTGHSFSFLTDGFETSSNVLAFALYELSKNEEVQERLREEVNDVLERHDGKLTYEALQEMKYLDGVMEEASRKYPPAMFLGKRCTKKVTIPGNEPGSTLTVEPGVKIVIPAHAIQMDPTYFPDPERFDPDRFTDEAKQERPKCTFLTFGEGPRQCLGMRFAFAQSKASLASVVKNFKLTNTSKNLEPMELDLKNFLYMAKGGLWVKFQKI